jgi:hypothetical protein
MSTTVSQRPILGSTTPASYLVRQAVILAEVAAGGPEDDLADVVVVVVEAEDLDPSRGEPSLVERALDSVSHSLRIADTEHGLARTVDAPAGPSSTVRSSASSRSSRASPSVRALVQLASCASTYTGSPSSWTHSRSSAPQRQLTFVVVFVYVVADQRPPRAAAAACRRSRRRSRASAETELEGLGICAAI